jgi:hypothetical protein
MGIFVAPFEQGEIGPAPLLVIGEDRRITKFHEKVFREIYGANPLILWRPRT